MYTDEQGVTHVTLNRMEWKNSALNRSDWGHGEWDTEPDKIQWIDEATDLDCLIVRNRLGGLCGYVGVPDTHPMHGVDYDTPDVDVHGGLTFADGCQKYDDDPARGICHIPAEGRPDNVHWFGFDCCHAWDLLPHDAGPNGFRNFDQIYRNVRYVTVEVTRLARQLAEAA